MTPPTPPPSSRLVRAAAAERAELDRHEQRLREARESLHAELHRIDSGLAEVAERRALLDRLAPGEANSSVAVRGQHECDRAPSGKRVLQGPKIREAAVRMLLAADAPEAVHYREWYERLRAGGYEIAGKNPAAVFLTQISRSPIVRRGTQPGVYELDRQAPARIRARLARLHAELRELTSGETTTADLSVIRTRRSELNTEIGQVERALEEAELVLGAPALGELAASA